jgi:hypothetical protein
MTTQGVELRLKGGFVGVIVVIVVLAKNADSLRHRTAIGSRACPPSAPILRPQRSTRQATGSPQQLAGNPCFRPQMTNVTSAHERPRAGARRGSLRPSCARPESQHALFVMTPPAISHGRLPDFRQAAGRIREAVSRTARFTRNTCTIQRLTVCHTPCSLPES